MLCRFVSDGGVSGVILSYLWFRSRALWTLSLKKVLISPLDMVACWATLLEYFSGFLAGASSSYNDCEGCLGAALA